MTLTDEQIAQLAAALDTDRITNRKDKPFDYLEGYDCIDKANEIFGYDGWSYRCISLQEISGANATRPMFESEVEVTIGSFDNGCHRSDVGHGIASNVTPEAIETARKGAVTDALKRALRSFGNQFGNSLYDKDHDRGAGSSVGRAPVNTSGVAGSSPAPPRPASPPREAPAIPPSPKQIETIASMLHQLDDVDQLEMAAVCERYKIDIEPKTDGVHFSKGLASAGLTGGTHGTASQLIDELLPLVKKEAKGVPIPHDVQAEDERTVTQVSSSPLPAPEDIKTAGDLFSAAWDHFKLQKAEVLDILGVETQAKIRDFGAAWKIVVAKQGAR